MPSVLPRQVRQLVQSHLSELAGRDVEIAGETLLIRDGQYCGHRYHAGELSAIWFREENEIKFYGEDDRVNRSLNVGSALAESTVVACGPSDTDEADRDERHSAA